jgi:hypothetical protein
VNHNYNGLQVSYKQNYAMGFTVFTTYTWSHNLGVPGDIFFPRDPFNVSLDYGPVNDVRHNFTTSAIWDTPWGNGLPALGRLLLANWEISGIFNARTGFPLTLRSGLDNSITATGQDTPDQIGSPSLTGSRTKAQEIAKWFNTAAFKPNATGTYGDVGIGTLRAPGFWNLDTAIAKSFPLGERRRLAFRCSFYNIFNHANLNSPVSTLTSPAFGVITTTSDPRVIEGALKLTF